ncbi:MAG: beta-CASP ribonuclease aCPSF1 [Caldisphaera sp.]|uniref:beta-CASP ribonuclease aCPSF1 n=1 Tax=Caldisphaera sp. TaxID=2060322 RepID=UPI00397B5B49
MEEASQERLISGQKLRSMIVSEILKNVRDAEISSIDFEGPEIAIYVKNPQWILEGEEKIRELAKQLRKRMVIRTDPKARKTREATIQYIMENTPEEAGITPSDIQFDEVLGEVRVFADKPGKLLGKGKPFRNQVLANTGWRLEVQRKSPLVSKTLASVLELYIRASSERRKALREIGERIYREMIVGPKNIRVIGLGSFGEVGRSSILLDTGESKILLDAGFAQSGYSTDAYPYFDAPEFRLEDLDAIVISHAHMDHMGLLPILYKYGYRGPSYMTPPTRDITVLMLKDFIDLFVKEGKEPPFTMKDINTMLTRTITVNYNVVTDLSPDAKLTFSDAGHILGSALTHIHIGQGLFNILYTGDIKYYKAKEELNTTRLQPPANTEFHRVEALIMETTYGATETATREEAETQLFELIKKVYDRKGKILIPVMAVGRAQDMMVLINKASQDKKIPEMPIYIDGLIYEVTAIYTSYPELLAKPIRDEILHNDNNPFIGPNMVFVNDSSKRDEAIFSQGPAIIISTSGMMTGGPILEYFKNLADNQNNALVFVSYQASGTLGRKIVEGEKEIQMMDGNQLKTIKVNLEVQRIEGFSGHANRSELQGFLRGLTPKPRVIILNHGEPSQTISFGILIKQKWDKLGFESMPEVVYPENLEAVRVFPRNIKLHSMLNYLQTGG